MTTLGAPQPPAVPAHFRFEWDTPDEALQPWAADMMHSANRASPLAAMPYVAVDSSAGIVRREH